MFPTTPATRYTSRAARYDDGGAVSDPNADAAMMNSGNNPTAGNTPQSLGGLASVAQSIGSNPWLSALIGAGLGYVGGGKSGAIGGALMGPALGNKVSSGITSGQNAGTSNSNLNGLLAQYLPLMLAQYAGAFYRNPTPQPISPSAKMSANLPTSAFSRAANPNANVPTSNGYYTYGQPTNPGSFYTGNTLNAPGSVSNLPGLSSLPGSAKGGAIDKNAGPLSQVSRFVSGGPGDGTSDDINAKLSNNEYVLDASTVSTLGNGSSEAGARKLDQFRENIRKHAGKKMVKGKQFMKAKEPEDYLEDDEES